MAHQQGEVGHGSVFPCVHREIRHRTGQLGDSFMQILAMTGSKQLWLTASPSPVYSLALTEVPVLSPDPVPEVLAYPRLADLSSHLQVKFC